LGERTGTESKQRWASPDYHEKRKGAETPQVAPEGVGKEEQDTIAPTIIASVAD